MEKPKCKQCGVPLRCGVIKDGCNWFKSFKKAQRYQCRSCSVKYRIAPISRKKEPDSKYGKPHHGYQSSKSGWAKCKLNTIRRTCERRGHEVDLTYKDIMDIMVDHCPVTGVELDYVTKGHRGKMDINTPSVDRVDNSKGYIKDNVIIVSGLVNRVKNNLSLPQIQTLLPRMVKFYEKYV